MRSKWLYAVLATFAGTAFMVSGAVSASAATKTVGGTVIEGGWNYSILDQGNPAYAGGANAAVGLVYGYLFDPPTGHGSVAKPDLAVSYSYNKPGTQLTINLRPGVKFQDGSPFTATVVVWNLQRYAQPTTSVAQDFTLVKSMKAVGKTKVVIAFTKPTGLLIPAFSSTAAGFMESPTSFNKLGQLAFGYAPVGAGPFQVTADTPGQSLTLTRWAGYYDAKHTYLQSIEFSNTGTDPQAQYNDLAAGSITLSGFSGSTTAPSILYQADRNPGLTRVAGLNTLTYILNININTAPFNDIRAREALAYCTDRETIANSTDQGYATPAYVIGGPDTEFMSGTVDGKLVTGWKYGKTLDPYLYDKAKGQALIQQLGGVSFGLYTTQGRTTGSPLAIALYQEWTACGMNVTNLSTSQAADVGIQTSGSFQVFLNSDAVAQYPGTNIAYQTYGGSLDSAQGGFNIPAIYALIAKANSTTNPVADAVVWHKVWAAEDKSIVDMPITAAPTYTYMDHCLAGTNFRGNSVETLVHAYANCPL